MKTTICKRCGKEIQVENLNVKYCKECKQIKKKEHDDYFNRRQSENSKAKAYNKAKKYIMKYINISNKNTTMIGFDEVSPISTREIVQAFRGKTWVDILKMFNKDDLLKKYIKKEYYNYDNTMKKSLKTFSDQHKYINYSLLQGLGTREFLAYCGRKILRNTPKDYEDNFYDVVNIYGYIPLYSEFIKTSKITIANYTRYLCIHKNVYDTIVKKYSTEEQYNDYLNRKRIRKIKVGKNNASQNKDIVSEKEMKENFKTIFDNFKKEYGKYPTHRMFDKMSKHDNSVYRRKYNKTWSEICKMYGYDTEEKCSAEYICLCKINKILNEKCVRQKTWDWLIGSKGFKLRVDGYYPNHNLVIEFDGKQHKEPVVNFGGIKTFKRQKANDFIKDELIPKHNISLIRISAYEDWFNENYLKEVLKRNKIIKNNADNNEEVS